MPHRLQPIALCLLGLALAGCQGTATSESEEAASVGIAASLAVRPLLLVGIDGATFDRILPLAEQGRVPNLAGLMERGSWGPLETLEPTVSPAIWTTVATGRLPEVHGIVGFDGVPGFTMSTLPTSQMRRVRAFWNVLSEHGRSVGIVGWWATWPAEPVDGFIVSDRFAYTRMEATLGRDEARPHDVFPAELDERIRPLVRRPDAITAEEVRRFMPLSDADVERLVLRSDYRHGDFLPEFRYVHQSDRSIADIALELMRSRPTDVTAVAFYGVDTVSHLTWHFMAPEEFPGWNVEARDVERFGGLIDRYYEYVDGIVGELLDAAGEQCNVMVFSDHGFGPTGATGQLPWSAGHGKLTRGAPVAPDGILILAGPSIRAGVSLDRPHVLDLTPMVLHLQGFPLAADMPGGVVSDALTDAFSEALPVRRVATYETGPRARPEGAPEADPELDAASRARLCALGYVDCE